MSDLFQRQQTMQAFGSSGEPVEPVAKSFGPVGCNVKLRIKHELKADGTFATPDVSLIVNGYPFSGLIQTVAVSIDATTMMPKVQVEFVPMQFEVEVEGVAVVEGKAIDREKIKELLGVYALNFPNQVFCRTPQHPDEFKPINLITKESRTAITRDAVLETMKQFELLTGATYSRPTKFRIHPSRWVEIMQWSPVEERVFGLAVKFDESVDANGVGFVLE